MDGRVLPTPTVYRMAEATQVLQWVTAAAFCGMTFVAARQYVREPELSRAWLVAALGLVAFVAVGGRVNRLLGPFPILSDLTLLAFAASGYALLEYRAAIVPLARKYRILAGTGIAGSFAFIMWGRFPRDQIDVVDRVALVVLLCVWAGCVLEPAVRFWLISGSQAPVRRARLRLLGTGYAGLAVTLVLAGFVFARLREQPLSFVFNLVVLCLVAVVYVAVGPPIPLRRWWLRRASEREVLTTSPVGSWFWDLAVRILVWTPAQHRIFGTDPATFVPTLSSVSEFVHPEDRERVRTMLEAQAAGGSHATDFRIIRADGELRWVHARGHAITDPGSGALTGMFGTIQDITERKEAEAALEEAVVRLRSLDEMKHKILEAVSHELRTPLTAMKGLAQTLEHRDPGSDVGRMASRIVANADRLEILLGDLLDLDRINRGVLEPNWYPVRIPDLVQGVLDHLSLNGHPLDVDIQDATVLVSPAQVERIIENLLVNASRHTPPTTPIWLRIRPENEGLLIVVEDAGPGVANHLKECIFESFRRGEGGAARAGGSGIGLALVAEFAELHGGRAWVEDRRGGGASFRVFLRAPAVEIEIGSPRTLDQPAS